MQKIKRLDSITINQIAAGEVIDRPASIIKECIENSIDASATKIHIEIEDGGKKSIRISDNGTGISKEDLQHAPLRHATSKITKINDIYTINSFGFRGEALASICHIAKLEIQSKTDSQEAFNITAYKDQISTPTPISHTNGTTILIKDLFKEMPVRYKFLKSNTTESAHIFEVITHFALIHPTIDFIFMNNQKELLNTTGIQKQDQLIQIIYGKATKNHLIKIDTHIGPIHFTGFISDPQLIFSNRSKQITAINHRLVKNPIIFRAIQQSYQDTIPSRKHPLIVLNLSLDPTIIDVNIHPQKNDIKFQNPGFLFDAFPKVIKANLNKEHKVLLKSILPFQADSKSQEKPTIDATKELFKPINQPSSLNIFDISTEKSNQDQEIKPEATPPSFEYLQLFDTYLVIKTVNGMYILDQHAVHERILYEKLKNKWNNKTYCQPLLISEIIDIPADKHQLILEHKNTLEYLNFIIDDFGSNQIIVREVPIDLTDIPLKPYLEIIIQDLLELNKISEQNKTDYHKLHDIACKAAIKAGKKMTAIEVKNLIHDFVSTPQNYTCPHGRPLFIELNKKDFEKMFKR